MTETKQESVILGPDGQPYQYETGSAAETHTEADTNQETRYDYQPDAEQAEEVAENDERRAIYHQLIKARLSGAPPVETYRTLAQEKGLDTQAFGAFEQSMEAFLAGDAKRLEGGTPEQRLKVNEAILMVLSEGKIDAKLFDALVSRVKIAEQPMEKPSNYEGAAGNVIAGVTENGELLINPDTDLADPLFRHVISHELGHLKEEFTDMEAYRALTSSRPAALESQYVRGILSKIEAGNKESPQAKVILAAAERERFAEDQAAFHLSQNEEEFLLNRLKGASESELEKYFATDTKGAQDLLRMINDPNPANRRLPKEITQLTTFQVVREENRQLFTFLSHEHQKVAGKSRPELDQLRGESGWRLPNQYDTSELTSGRAEQASGWLGLLYEIFASLFKLDKQGA